MRRKKSLAVTYATISVYSLFQIIITHSLFYALIFTKRECEVYETHYAVFIHIASSYIYSIKWQNSLNRNKVIVKLLLHENAYGIFTKLCAHMIVFSYCFINSVSSSRKGIILRMQLFIILQHLQPKTSLVIGY